MNFFHVENITYCKGDFMVGMVCQWNVCSIDCIGNISQPRKCLETANDVFQLCTIKNVNTLSKQFLPINEDVTNYVSVFPCSGTPNFKTICNMIMGDTMGKLVNRQFNNFLDLQLRSKLIDALQLQIRLSKASRLILQSFMHFQ